ncbi:MAG TPA: glycosyl hydrolase family 28-related protein [Verrucomicrobiae bacterium]|nr:glycosyl hydrolase family 28-related protein [Verrucomicrobiae bacterium]
MICIVSAVSVKATSGASVPWMTYEAENMLVSGGTILGPQYNPIRIPTEASGRMCVQLDSTGQYVQFTNQSAATALVVRYCVPDTSDGVGADYTLSLYTNGVLAARLPVTSKYSWLYGNYPFSNNPSLGFARNFFDEVRTNGLILNPGTVVRLQKDATDTASYYVIDLVDVENVPAAPSQPANSLAVTNYSAVGNGVTDCTTDFQNCINAANSQSKSVWIPPGDFLITGTINLYSNTKLLGAGMWYSRLVGSPSLYTTPSRRVNLNGSGSNINLSDFAIVGCLNYRNDYEGNDGLGGSYGTGSSISRIWIEHTKSAAWIFNSSGLVVDSCRFRDTLADGINVNYAMQNTIVTNCTTRGTGDDCFAIWPSPNSGSYTPGNNVITHCTGQLPFLANGGADYGGANNRIEDCLFSDLCYGAGILFSTTFNVSYTFSGTNVAQRCDIIRCGGYDGGYGWRSALQIVIDNYGSNGIPGLNLNNLNIIDSVSTGFSILGGAGPLTNATATSVNIPDYNLNNISGQHAWWAKCYNGCPIGSMTVSNSVVPEYQNDSGTFNFNFISNVVHVSVQPSVAGAAFLVDGTTCTNTNTFTWPQGSNHTLAASNSQSAWTGTQYVWNSWSDGGAISHSVSPTLSTNYTANFTTQYYLTLNSGLGGSVSPVSMWTNSGVSLSINATPSNGFAFSNWIGTGNGCYSGGTNPAMITLNGPVVEQAAFLPPAPSITKVSVNSSNTVLLKYQTQPGFYYHVETTTNLVPPSWAALSGSTTNASGTLATFTDTNQHTGGRRFYRAVSP